MTINQIRISDVDLIKRIAQDDKDAFNSLYDRYSQLAYNLANKIVRDEDYAGEAMQSVFWQVWNRADTYNEKKGAVSTWIINITRNKAIDILRRNKKNKINISTEYEELESDINFDLNIMELRERREIIIKGMGIIPPEQKNIIELIYLQGYTQREVAEMLEIPLGTVKTRIHLGIGKLREILSPYLKEI